MHLKNSSFYAHARFNRLDFESYHFQPAAHITEVGPRTSALLLGSLKPHIEPFFSCSVCLSSPILATLFNTAFFKG